MKIKQFYIYLVNLDPQFGTEPGKVRPVVVVQTNLLNPSHYSTIVCPTTTKVKPDATLLRVHLCKKETKLKEDSDILVDQIRSVDNRRFIKEIGKISQKNKEKLIQNLQIILFE
ncbi:type II toxin-antitoxin system PemK/MazF family toxin [Candidatus Peregrinibacteria bacterium CG_4_10_14_0_2_um_filter_43_11]|nr:MAG: type II toxin-antitoxin system PemK/MazF family toxin [Candidatus Peregrinibacteria bacterium CG_4_10_14_0_2_um_filter_43_11]